uniref:Phosphoribosyl-AMP cyclohydrolase domain-containing protein n=1 Tax=Globisporangium ultimum (strain ATCC 200006 / CBS 805.95 / DAOM BR144) TaxID=431595 RepID=K3X3I1_GLOUD
MLVPELELHAAALQNEAKKAPEAQWEQVRKISIINCLYAHLSVEKLVALAPVAPESGAISESELLLKAVLLDSRAVLGPFSGDMMESAASWLDQGTQRVLVNAASSDDADLETVATAVSELPASRVVLRIPVALGALVNREEDNVLAASSFALQLQDKIKRLSESASGIVLALQSETSGLESAADSEEYALLFKTLVSIRKGLDEGFFFAVEWSALKQENFNREALVPCIAELHHKGIHVVAPGLSVVTESESAAYVDAGRAFIKCLRSDRPDGLFTTVVADEAGVALGLVYSSEESVLAAIESGRGVYYSRSRKGLWKKGESSGNFQALVQLDVDCDSDALRFTVEQTGAGFCHLNTRTCWGEARGLQHLQQMLVSRLQDAPEGSYTKRLFNDPVLLRNKLVEEAQELAEAETISDVAGEAADVMYFAITRCVAAGATLKDVEKYLDKRALKVKRRPGNSKAYRIEAAAEILKKKD